MIEVPNPAGSANEKWQPTRWGLDTRIDRLRQLLLKEKVDENLANGFAMAMANRMQYRVHERRELLEEFSRWANTHTHTFTETPVEPLPTTMYMVGATPITAKFASYTPSSWTTLTSRPATVGGRTAEKIGNVIHSVDPFNNHSGYSWDINTSTWTAFAGLPIGRERGDEYRVVTANDGSKIFVIGGHSPAPNPFVMDLLDIFDISLGTWSSGTNLPDPRLDSFNVVVGNTLYVFGGNNVNVASGLDTLLKYNISTDTWSSLTGVLPEGRMWLGGAYDSSVNGIWLVGGRQVATAQTNLWLFDINTETVLTGYAPFPIPKYGLSCIRLQDGLHALAGRIENGSNVFSHHRYSIDTDSWTTQTDTPSRGLVGLTAA